MKKKILLWAATLVAAAAFTSCAYDPYYASGYYARGTYNASGGYNNPGYGYSNGYNADYGYGGHNFSTSVFVSTGDPRWGYDPNCYCYYDYYRRCYYDPYLYGYYPVGFFPPIVIGCPHPYGWRPGHGHCPPPHMVRNTALRNYQNREGAYRNSNYGWSHQVRQTSYPNLHNSGNRANGGNSNKSFNNYRSSNNTAYGNWTHNQSRQLQGNSYGRDFQNHNFQYQAGNHNTTHTTGETYPQGYNSPVFSAHDGQTKFDQQSHNPGQSHTNGHFQSGVTNYQGTSSYSKPRIYQHSSTSFPQHTYPEGHANFQNGGGGYAGGSHGGNYSGGNHGSSNSAKGDKGRNH